MELPDIRMYQQIPERQLYSLTPIYDFSYILFPRLLSAYICLEAIQTERQDLSAKEILLAGVFRDVVERLGLDDVI
jgi:hypothetical protein